MPVQKKTELDREIATLLGVSKSDVSLITAEFLRRVMQAVVRDEEVHLDGFGTFRLKKVKYGNIANLKIGSLNPQRQEVVPVPVDNMYRVNFSKAPAFRRAIAMRYSQKSEDNMDKYGVDESVGDDEQLEKKASNGCPSCGGKVQKHGRVLMCERCGSEPFESKDK